MKFTATQIAGILEGKVEGNPNAEVWNVAKIEEGAPGMISFLANPKYTHYIYETQSSIVIVNDDFEATAPISATLIRVPDAYACFAKLLALGVCRRRLRHWRQYGFVSWCQAVP